MFVEKFFNLMSSIFNLHSSDFDVFVSSEKDFQIDVFALSDKNCGLFLFLDFNFCHYFHPWLDLFNVIDVETSINSELMIGRI